MCSAKMDIEVGKSVIEVQIEGLESLCGWLGDDFAKAVELVFSTQGRVVLSGMGKSGHIANKIAATLASTGTPAFFVHPGEASHGDLGMISPADVVILLSNSGETKELRDIIDYCKRFSIPIIGFVRRKSSVLVNASDVALVLPDVPEACVVNAPTTSTTMMLVLGDALAVALLEKRGFNKENFGVFHPGGKLGAVFLKVSDLMHQGDEVPLVHPNLVMSDVLIEMTSKRFGCVGVVDSQTNKLLGVITDGDLRRHMSEGLLGATARQVMTESPKVVTSDSLVSAALSLMQNMSITSLFVVDSEGVPTGVLHIHDVLRSGIV